MRIAMLSPIAWRTPPEHYGPWELVSSLLTEELVKKGLDVTLFATGNSLTKAKLLSVTPEGYEEKREIDAKVAECLHVANCMQRADDFDIIHNQFDFLPLTYSRLIKTPVVTTIHGFSSPKILPVYEKYNDHTHYVSISYSNRAESLSYISNIYHGINLEDYQFNEDPTGNYLLFLGRIHPDKGAHHAIEIAKRSGLKLILAGIIQDQKYFEEKIKPHLSEKYAEYVGSVGLQQKNQLMGNALALLHPIGFSEPFGLSVAESMACGTPVIAFSKGSMPELIDHEKDGFLVSDVEEAIKAVSGLDKIQRLNCRKKIKENFSKEIMAENYIRTYRKILEMRD